MDWTGSMVWASPPPKTMKAPLMTAPAASWVAWLSEPSETAAPVAGSTRKTVAREPPAAGSPPSNTTRSPSARATTRDTGAGNDAPPATVSTRSAGLAAAVVDVAGAAAFARAFDVWPLPLHAPAAMTAAARTTARYAHRFGVTAGEATAPDSRGPVTAA